MIQRANAALSRVVPLLWADVAFEFIVCVIALALATTDAAWVGIPHAWLYGIAAAFGAAGVAIVPIARQPRAPVVILLGWANALGGTAGWVVLALYWGNLAPPQRWLLAAVMDGFLVLALLELMSDRPLSYLRG